MRVLAAMSRSPGRPTAFLRRLLARWVTPRAADHDELCRKLSWYGPSNSEGRFLNLFVDHNNKCNLRCRTCGFSDGRVRGLPRYDMPRAMWDELARTAFPRTSTICLSLMTEPFMTADVLERIQLVREHGVPFSEIITNGTLLSERNVRGLIDAQVTRVSVSIDGGTKEVFEHLRPGARFERVVDAVRRFRRIRAEVGASLPLLRINHVLSEPNVDRFGDFLALVEGLGPEEIAVRTVERMSDAEIQECSDPRFWRKVRRCREELAELCRRTGVVDSGYLRDRPGPIRVLDSTGSAMTCQRPWNTLAIHPDGDVYPCMAWSRPPLGNLRTRTIWEIWNGPELRAVRQEFLRAKPGIDCHCCTIRRGADDPDDDFFYRKLAKPDPAKPLPAPGTGGPSAAGRRAAP